MSRGRRARGRGRRALPGAARLVEEDRAPRARDPPDRLEEAIAVAALLGLLPFAPVSTSNLAVALALATVSFVAQQVAGIRKHGLAGHFRHLMPPGLPLWLLPIILMMLVMGGLLMLAQGSAVAPFIYTLF